MARYQFTQGKEYAARVHAVWEKPVENTGLSLVRLEFEVFQFLDGGKLSSMGKIACRDVIVGPAIDNGRDAGVGPFFVALGISHPNTPADWLALNNRRPWVTLVFGPVGHKDERNAFVRIFSLDARKYQVVEHDYALDADWVTVAEAADDLECSPSTLRRRVAEMEPEFGERLVRRTPGGHRRINVRLLRNLM